MRETGEPSRVELGPQSKLPVVTNALEPTMMNHHLQDMDIIKAALAALVAGESL